MTYRTIATCLLVMLALVLLASMEPCNVWLFTLTGIVAVSALWVGLRHSRRWGKAPKPRTVSVTATDDRRRTRVLVPPLSQARAT